MNQTVERKLTTILCADMCGYSRQMGKDEEGTLLRLKQAREVFSTYVRDYSGRIVNMTGDGLVADFSSVVQAVHCAVSIQNHFNEQQTKTPDQDPMIFRIGLNLGDVIIEGTDIFGEGVNVAARLEAMTPPGGILISGTVYDHVKGKFPDSFDFLGNKHVKNIEEAIPVYSLGLAHEPVPHKPERDLRQTQNTDTNSTKQEEQEEQEEQELRAIVKKQAKFYRRALSAGSIIVFLFLINIMTSPSYFWFIWPALPMLLILAMDAIRIFGKGQLSYNWEEKKLAEFKKEKKSRS